MKSEDIHILVIRLSAMGDVAMTVPVLRAFLAQNNSVKITVLTHSYFKPFFKELKNTTIFCPDLKGKHKNFLGLLKLYNTLTKLNIHLVIDLHSVLRSSILVALFKLSGIKCYQLNKGRKEKKVLISATNHTMLFPLKSMHERYAEVFRRAGFPLSLKENYPTNRGEIPSYIKNKLHGKKLVGIAPFAAYKSKRLPISKIKELIHQLTLNKKVSILLFGGGSKEKEVLEAISKNHQQVHSVVQKITFEEELNLISNLDVMIAMDSGNGHIAAMFNVPVITIWGVTHPYLGFTPFNQPFENQVLSDLKKFPLIPTSVYGKDYPKEYLHCFDSIQAASIILKVKNYID